MDDAFDRGEAMNRFMRFCLSVILGCIALYFLINLLIIFGYIGFMGWFATSLMSERSHEKPTPPKVELHRSAKPCPPLSKTPPGTALRHDCDYSSQGPVR